MDIRDQQNITSVFDRWNIFIINDWHFSNIKNTPKIFIISQKSKSFSYFLPKAVDENVD